jgi:outer membrane immunogenic protein
LRNDIEQGREEFVLMKTGYLGVAGLLLCMGCVSHAADLAMKPVYKAAPIIEPAPVASWSGIYLGGQVGYAWSNGGYTLSQATGSEAFAFNPGSVIGGGHIGAQGQWGHLVLGAEGTYSATDLQQTQLSTIVLPGASRVLKTDGIATVVGKIGFAQDNLLFYGKGGWADMNLSTHTASALATSDTSGWVSGYTLGAGIDYMWTRNFILGADFNYYRVSTNRSTTFSTGAWANFNGINDNVYAVMVRGSYLFNAWH